MIRNFKGAQQVSPKIKRVHTSSLTRSLLEKVMEVGELTLDVFLPPRYPETWPAHYLSGSGKTRCSPQRTCMALLSRLKNQGLVERCGPLKTPSWRITDRGQQWLAERVQMSHVIAEDGIGRLVIFDIPEQERKKRDAVRAELVAANFRQLQKSVWIGYCPLPETFLELLDQLELAGKVHIFSIRDGGTLPDSKKR